MSFINKRYCNIEWSNFDKNWKDWSDNFLRLPSLSINTPGDQTFPTDIDETNEEYIISIDLPGFNKDDINVSLTNNDLSVKGKRESGNNEKRSIVRRGRYHGEFHKTFSFEKDVDGSHIEARYENGILSITVPKTKSSRATDIKVN